MKNIQILICILLFSCGKQAADNDPDMGDMKTNIICDDLDEAACKADDKCLPIMGQSLNKEKSCFDVIQFVACVDAEEAECNNNGIIGFFERDGTCWYQSGRCTPQSWYDAESMCGAENLIFCSEL